MAISGQRKPTQSDVAALAGVSPAIVSAVVNARPAGNIRVSEATRERVRQAVRELGYVPNIAARNLARGRNHILGIFSYESVFPLESMNFYHEFLVGIEEAAEQAGYNLLMFSAAKTAGGGRSVYSDGGNSLQLADGSVLVGTHERPDEIATLAQEQYPFVIIGRRAFPGAEVSYAAGDYAGGTRDAVKALTRLGHQKIAMVRGVGEHESVVDRRAGFAQARRRVAAANSPVRTLEDDRRAGRILTELVEAGVTAIIAESTEISQVLRRAARRQGIGIPRRLSLLDLGGKAMADEPQISTLVIPRREMGRTAVQLLLKLLDDPTAGPLQSTIPCQLKLTDSIGPPPDV